MLLVSQSNLLHCACRGQIYIFTSHVVLKFLHVPVAFIISSPYSNKIHFEHHAHSLNCRISDSYVSHAVLNISTGASCMSCLEIYLSHFVRRVRHFTCHISYAVIRLHFVEFYMTLQKKVCICRDICKIIFW